MATLTGCMKKAGKALRDEDRADILARFNALVEGGAKAGEAARQAVDEQIATVQGLLGAEAGSAPAFSRTPPRVTTEVTEEGFPSFVTDDVAVSYPRESERFEVFPGPGEKVVNYSIGPSDGSFAVWGHVDLLVKDGKPISLLDIEVYEDAEGRGKGIGRKVMEALLGANPESDLNISNIVEDARGFWAKMGVPEQNRAAGEAYEGNLNWQIYSENAGGSGGVFARGEAARGRRDAGREGGSRQADRQAQSPSAAQRGDIAAVQSVVNDLTQGWGSAPTVVVAQSMQDEVIPQEVRDADQEQKSRGADGEPEGFFYDGKVYLLASRLKNSDDVARVLFHEALGHAGLRAAFGKRLDPILDQMAKLYGPAVRAKAKQYGLDMGSTTGRRTAAEEVLAELAQTRPESTWVQKAVAAIRGWLRENVPGMASLKLTDAEIIERFIVPARNAIERRRDGSKVVLNRMPTTHAEAKALLKERGYDVAEDDNGAPLITKDGKDADYKALPIELRTAWNVLSMDDGEAYTKDTRFQRVWHGTPYRGIEKFSTDSMGTGEGNQAYGWGLYFASKKEIADHYRRELSSANGGKARFDSNSMIPSTVDSVAAVAESKQRLIAKLERDLEKETDPAWRKRLSDNIAVEREKLAAVERKGQLYEVEIPADDSMLLWDKPLSEQPAKVREALLKAIDRDPDDGEPAGWKAETGQRFYRETLQEREGSDQAASEWLRVAGIKGIKYLDGTSRPANVDDSRAMKLLEKNGNDVDAALKEFMRSVYNTPKAKAGIEAEMRKTMERLKDAAYNYVIFSGEDAEIRGAMFSRSSTSTAEAFTSLQNAKLPAGYILNDLFKSSGKVSWWSKTVGTMHDLAQKNPAFKKVYDSAQNFINDVSYYATQSADLAPSLLPKLESFRDIAKAPLSAEDTKAISAPIFEGTLSWTRDENGEPVKSDDPQKAGIVWTDAELKSKFGLSDKQIGLYREFRAATDKSLTHLAISDMIRFAGKDAQAVAQEAMDSGDVTEAAALIADRLEQVAANDPGRADVLADTAEKLTEKADKVLDLIARGYAPLSRYGHYTLDAVDEKGERVYFGLFESEREANKMARLIRAEYPNAAVTQGTMSQKAYQMFAGVSPETLELFGDMLGLEADGDSASAQVFQEYLKAAKNSRSAMKRLIERKGILGFSEDAGRVLAGFAYSNARQTSKNLHFGAITQATHDIAKDKSQGELADVAAGLHQYITNPQEEAQKIKGLLFTQFLGGSIASAMVNLTQPIAVTFPYLSQYGGAVKAAKQMKNALADAVKWETTSNPKLRTTGDKALDAAMKKAEEDGIVSPQEVHSLIAQAGGGGSLKAGDGTAAGDLAAKGSNFMSKAMLAWGRPFAVAEQFNRRATFIAAYRTAVEQKMDDPDGFAARTIAETQFTYNKANRPQWARGAIGSTLFTFKQYSISYVELMTRMAKSGPEGRKAAALGLAVLFLMAGLQGLPGADDLDDLIDGAMQRMGYNWNTAQQKREVLASLVGEGGAMFLMRGLSGLPGTPIDVSGRLGLGNLIPGTGLLTKKADYSRDAMEILGPAGSFAQQIGKGASKLVEGEFGKAVEAILPVAAANAVKGADMASTGMYRDVRGRKVIDTDGIDAAFKAIGFQPNDVARVQRATGEVQEMVAQTKIREAEIADKWARGMFEKNPDLVQEARDELVRWNENNTTTPIRISSAQIVKRLQAMRQDKTTRLEKTAPKEVRAAVRKELEGVR